MFLAHVGCSSSTWESNPCIYIGSLNHWTTTEVTGHVFLFLLHFFLFYFSSVIVQVYCYITCATNSCSLFVIVPQVLLCCRSMGKVHSHLGRSLASWLIYDHGFKLSQLPGLSASFGLPTPAWYCPRTMTLAETTGNLWCEELSSGALALKLYPSWGAALHSDLWLLLFYPRLIVLCCQY